MKILLVETSVINKNADVTVHIRNSFVLEQYLKKNHDCRLVSQEEDITDIEEQFNYIIFISATFYFKHERFSQLIHNQKNCKLGWITNEYELFMQDFLKQHSVDFIIANFEEWGLKKAHKHDKFLMTNLNALMAKPRNECIQKEYDIVYYGTYRKYRDSYFKKYLIDDMVLSTSGKNVKKFQLLNCDCWLMDKMSWKAGEETLNSFKASLYIEDTKTHKLFNYMANRFFEALFCNCALFFDKSCTSTISKDAYKIPDYFIVDSYADLMGKIEYLNMEIVDDFISVNTDIALKEKAKTLRQVEDFLVQY